VLFARIHERFPPESPIEVSRTKLLKLRHEWGKAYEYLAEFNELTDVLNLPENVRKQVLIQQVRPSVREAFYEIEDKQRNLENLTEKLLQCDTHPEAYKNDYLEKIDVRRDHQIILMALLDVIDPCKPSKQANMRRKSNNQSQIKFERVKVQQNNPTENRKFEFNKDKPQFRKNSNSSYNKNNASVGNNPIPTSYSIMTEPKEASKTNGKPIAWLENNHQDNYKTRAQAMFDNDSGMNVIHTDLVRKLGLKVKEQPTVCNTINGKVTLKYTTEDFKVRLKLRPEGADKEKWYEFTTTGQISDAIPNTLLLGVKFMDSHGIYRKIGNNQRVEYCIADGYTKGNSIKGDTSMYVNPTENREDNENNNPTVNKENDIYYIEALTEYNEKGITINNNYIELPTAEISIEAIEGIIENPTENKTKVHLEKVWYAQEVEEKKQLPENKNEDLVKENEELVNRYYKDLWDAFNEAIAAQLPEHRHFDCKIELEPGAELTHGPTYPMNPQEEAELKEFLDEMEGKGFIRRSESEAAYPVLYVPKKTGDKRLCTDYRKLNKVTKRNSFL